MALNQIMKDVISKESATLNELPHATTKTITKRKNRNRTTNKQPAWKQKFGEKLKLGEVNYQYWKTCQKE